MKRKQITESPEPLLTPIKVTFLTQAELANEMGVCQMTIYRWTRDKRIPCLRIGSRTVRYNPELVRNYLANQAGRVDVEEEAALEMIESHRKQTKK